MGKLKCSRQSKTNQHRAGGNRLGLANVRKGGAVSYSPDASRASARAAARLRVALRP
jgi:hypothetical protein